MALLGTHPAKRQRYDVDGAETRLDEINKELTRIVTFEVQTHVSAMATVASRMRRIREAMDH